MNSNLYDPAFWSRLQFGFTLTYHYLFPQLTMGLAWFIVYWKWCALRTGDEKYNQAVRFWAKIFGLNFAVGVVTGIPMEFQFGTNWSEFSRFAGGVIVKGGWPGFLRAMTGEHRPANLSDYERVVFLAALGEKDMAFAEPLKAYEVFGLVLKVDPLFDPLRNDRRFAEILTRIGFPPE